MRFEKQVFRNQQIELDFNEFVDCRFENCNVVVRGLAMPAYRNCHFEACNFHFDGPAALTLTVLRDFHQNMHEVAELAIKAIRGEFQAPKAH